MTSLSAITPVDSATTDSLSREIGAQLRARTSWSYGVFRDLGVPRSTAASWIRRGQRLVVSAQVLSAAVLFGGGLIRRLEECGVARRTGMAERRR